MASQDDFELTDHEVPMVVDICQRLDGLPLAIELGDVQVGSLSFNGSEQLKGLQMVAHWSAEGLQIDSVQLQRDELSLKLSGLLQPRGDWPPRQLTGGAMIIKATAAVAHGG